MRVVLKLTILTADNVGVSVLGGILGCNVTLLQGTDFIECLHMVHTIGRSHGTISISQQKHQFAVCDIQ